MVPEGSVLVQLVMLVDLIPMLDPPPRQRGRPQVYPDRLFLKALVIMVVRHLAKVHTLLSVLEEDTPEMRQLRALLIENGRYPTRRTWERRLAAIPATLPAQIGLLGRALVWLLQPWQDYGRAAAIDSTVLRALGGVWHKKDRVAGKVPHTSIDTEAGWTKSGWHGWVYGWKLHLVVTAAAVWIPLAAELTPANTADNTQAPTLLAELPPSLGYLLGDSSYNDPALDQRCADTGIQLVASSRKARYPHTDPGVEVRRVFHSLRSRSIENFNEVFKALFDSHGQVPTRGLVNTQRYMLAGVFVYQLSLLYRFQTGAPLRVGLKPFLKAA
jgi:hypothetical protein